MNITSRRYEIMRFLTSLFGAFSISLSEAKGGDIPTVCVNGQSAIPLATSVDEGPIVDILTRLGYVAQEVCGQSDIEFILHPTLKLANCPDIDIIIDEVEMQLSSLQ
jgi:hypothetical protein